MACEAERATLDELLTQVPGVVATVQEAVTRLNTLISQIESARLALLNCEMNNTTPPGP